MIYIFVIGMLLAGIQAYSEKLVSQNFALGSKFGHEINHSVFGLLTNTIGNICSFLIIIVGFLLFSWWIPIVTFLAVGVVGLPLLVNVNTIGLHHSLHIIYNGVIILAAGLLWASFFYQ